MTLRENALTRPIRLGLLSAALALSTAALASAEPLKVTLLGTGSPNPSPTRFSQSTLIEAGDQKLLIDMGRGATIRLDQIGVQFGSISAHFVTHMHSDHLSAFPDLWMTGWLGTPYGSRVAPMAVYGPTGMVEMTKNLTEAFSEDIRIRLADELLPPEGIAFDATDIAPGEVYNSGGVVVTAFEVNHGELIKPAYGYKVEYDGKAVVITGDTTYDERIAEAAAGADLLIHEVASIDPEIQKEYPKFQQIAAHHTSPEEAGRIFAKAQPKLAVYSHIIQRRATKAPPLPRDVDEIANLTRTSYGGPLLIGEDLMSFVIDDAVQVRDKDGNEVTQLD